MRKIHTKMHLRINTQEFCKSVAKSTLQTMRGTAQAKFDLKNRTKNLACISKKNTNEVH